MDEMESRILSEFIADEFEEWLKNISTKYSLDADHLGSILCEILFNNGEQKQNDNEGVIDNER